MLAITGKVNLILMHLESLDFLCMCWILHIEIFLLQIYMNKFILAELGEHAWDWKLYLY